MILKDKASPSTALDHPEAKARRIICRSRLACCSAKPRASGIGPSTGGGSINHLLTDSFECKNSGSFVLKNCHIIWSHWDIWVSTVNTFSAEPHCQIKTRHTQSVYQARPWVVSWPWLAMTVSNPVPTCGRSCIRCEEERVQGTNYATMQDLLRACSQMGWPALHLVPAPEVRQHWRTLLLTPQPQWPPDRSRRTWAVPGTIP